MSLSEKEHLISKEKALEHSIMRLIIGVVVQTPNLEKWRGAVISPDPLEIYDINGSLLFYEFTVEKNGKEVGRIKASASKILGPPVYTMEIGPRKWNVDKAIEMAKKVVLEKYKDVEVISTQFVCYSYPRIGVLIKIEHPKTKEEMGSIVVDVASHLIIPRIAPNEEGFNSAMWSFYNTVLQKDRNDNIARWETDNHSLEMFNKAMSEGNINIRRALSDTDLERIGNILGLDLKKKQTDFDFAVSSLIYILPRSIITLTLYGQEHQCWCACATGQMILKHHNYYYEQPEIAVEMSTIPQPQDIPNWNPGPPDFHPCGTTVPNIQSAIESLSHNYLNTTVYTKPRWPEIVSELKRSQPLYSNIKNPKHARACAGYQSLYYIQQTALIAINHKSLYIYDPWPPNTNNDFCNPQGGAEYWEDWDISRYFNFIFVRPCKGTMVCKRD